MALLNPPINSNQGPDPKQTPTPTSYQFNHQNPQTRVHHRGTVLPWTLSYFIDVVVKQLYVYKISQISRYLKVNINSRILSIFLIIFLESVIEFLYFLNDLSGSPIILGLLFMNNRHINRFNNSASTLGSTPTTNNYPTINRKKLAKRFNKQNNHYKEYPLLNLYILIAMIASVIEAQFLTEVFKFIHGIPTLLMAIYISNKISQRNHIVPKLVKLGLVLSCVGDFILSVDQEKAGETFGAACYFVAFALYCISMSLGQAVRVYDFLFMFFIKILAFMILIGQIGLRYYLHSQQISKVIPKKPTYQGESPINNQESSPFLNSALLGVSVVLVAITFTRYPKTSPYSYGFSVAAVSCLLIFINIWVYQTEADGSKNSKMLILLMKLGYHIGQYLLMHGSLHHSNMLYQIQNFIKNKEKEGTTGVGSTLKQEQMDIRSNNNQLYFDIDNKCQYERETNSSDDQGFVDPQKQMKNRLKKQKNNRRKNK